MMLEAGSFTVIEGGEGDAAAPIGALAERMPRVIALSKLVLAKDNPRRGGTAELEQLAADIAAHGVLQNLIGVEDTPGGKVRIVAGGRRRRALQLLVRRGTYSADHLVPVQLVADDAAAEASLAENVQRLQMSAADEASAYAGVLAAEGVAPADVAHRFGVTERHVLQRLRLARLAKPVFDALRAGKITLEIAQAYASVDDPERQAAVWKTIKGTSYPGTVRREMSRGGMGAGETLARFVGREAYVAAGGRVERDLFTDGADEVWQDVSLLEELARPRLESAAAATRDVHGFAECVFVFQEWGRLDIDLERHVPEGLNHWQAFDPVKLPDDVRAGLVVAIAPRLRDDRVIVETLQRAWVHPGATPVTADDVDALADDEAGERPVDRSLRPADAPADPSHAPREVEDDTRPLPQVLRDELAMRRRDALALALIEDDGGIARDLIDFLLIENSRWRPGPATYRDDGCGLVLNVEEPLKPTRDKPLAWRGDSLDAALRDARGETESGVADDLADDTWLHLKDIGDRFHAFLALPGEVRRRWGRIGIASALQASASPLHGAVAQALGGVDPAGHWRPTADGFFARAGKAACLAMLGECLGAQVDGSPADVATWAKWKKAELANACAALARGDAEKLGGLGDRDRAAVEARGLTWLPAEMRFTP